MSAPGWQRLHDDAGMDAQLSAILRPTRNFLFVLDNAAVDLEVGEHLQSVDRAGRRMASGQDQAAQLGNQRDEGAESSGASGKIGFLLRRHGSVVLLRSTRGSLVKQEIFAFHR